MLKMHTNHPKLRYLLTDSEDGLVIFCLLYCLTFSQTDQRSGGIALVGAAGLEPTTFGPPARRATNCATPRH